MKFSIKDCFSKCDQIHRKLRICSHLLKKSLVENFIFLCNDHCILRFLQIRYIQVSAPQNVGDSLEKPLPLNRATKNIIN